MAIFVLRCRRVLPTAHRTVLGSALRNTPFSCLATSESSSLRWWWLWWWWWWLWWWPWLCGLLGLRDPPNSGPRMVSIKKSVNRVFTAKLLLSTGKDRGAWGSFSVAGDRGSGPPMEITDMAGAYDLGSRCYGAICLQMLDKKNQPAGAKDKLKAHVRKVNQNVTNYIFSTKAKYNGLGIQIF